MDTNKKNKIMKRRIKNDMKLVQKNNSDTIWVEWKYNHFAYAIICGPEDTPYAHGFYGFDFKFKDVNYPFENPKVQFHTFHDKHSDEHKFIPQLINFSLTSADSDIPRLHPNLYQKGYVCLSLLGTWRGDGWSSCYNILTIAYDLQQLLCEEPLRREPGQSTANIKKVEAYNFMVTHANIRINVIGMLRNTPTKYECFREKMINYFLKHFDSYIDTCDSNIDNEMNGTIVYFQLYRWQEYIDYVKLKDMLYELKKDLETETETKTLI
jgi:ubiquitin-protein ligase